MIACNHGKSVCTRLNNAGGKKQQLGHRLVWAYFITKPFMSHAFDQCLVPRNEDEVCQSKCLTIGSQYFSCVCNATVNLTENISFDIEITDSSSNVTDNVTENISILESTRNSTATPSIALAATNITNMTTTTTTMTASSISTTTTMTASSISTTSATTSTTTSSTPIIQLVCGSQYPYVIPIAGSAFHGELCETAPMIITFSTCSSQGDPRMWGYPFGDKMPSKGCYNDDAKDSTCSPLDSKCTTVLATAGCIPIFIENIHNSISCVGYLSILCQPLYASVLVPSNSTNASNASLVLVPSSSMTTATIATPTTTTSTTTTTARALSCSSSYTYDINRHNQVFYGEVCVNRSVEITFTTCSSQGDTRIWGSPYGSKTPSAGCYNDDSEGLCTPFDSSCTSVLREPGCVPIYIESVHRLMITLGTLYIQCVEHVTSTTTSTTTPPRNATAASIMGNITSNTTNIISTVSSRRMTTSEVDDCVVVINGTENYTYYYRLSDYEAPLTTTTITTTTTICKDDDSCATLVGLCSHPTIGSMVRATCPAMCGLCLATASTAASMIGNVTSNTTTIMSSRRVPTSTSFSTTDHCVVVNVTENYTFISNAISLNRSASTSSTTTTTSTSSTTTTTLVPLSCSIPLSYTLDLLMPFIDAELCVTKPTLVTFWTCSSEGDPRIWGSPYGSKTPQKGCYNDDYKDSSCSPLDARCTVLVNQPGCIPITIESAFARLRSTGILYTECDDNITTTTSSTTSTTNTPTNVTVSTSLTTTMSLDNASNATNATTTKRAQGDFFSNITNKTSNITTSESGVGGACCCCACGKPAAPAQIVFPARSETLTPIPAPAPPPAPAPAPAPAPIPPPSPPWPPPLVVISTTIAVTTPATTVTTEASSVVTSVTTTLASTSTSSSTTSEFLTTTDDSASGSGEFCAYPVSCKGALRTIVTLSDVSADDNLDWFAWVMTAKTSLKSAATQWLYTDDLRVSQESMRIDDANSRVRRRLQTRNNTVKFSLTIRVPTSASHTVAQLEQRILSLRQDEGAIEKLRDLLRLEILVRCKECPAPASIAIGKPVAVVFGNDEQGEGSDLKEVEKEAVPAWTFAVAGGLLSLLCIAASVVMFVRRGGCSSLNFTASAVKAKSLPFIRGPSRKAEGLDNASGPLPISISTPEPSPREAGKLDSKEAPWWEKESKVTEEAGRELSGIQVDRQLEPPPLTQPQAAPELRLEALAQEALDVQRLIVALNDDLEHERQMQEERERQIVELHRQLQEDDARRIAALRQTATTSEGTSFPYVPSGSPFPPQYR